jgi:hypothetical protein
MPADGSHGQLNRVVDGLLQGFVCSTSPRRLLSASSIRPTCVVTRPQAAQVAEDRSAIFGAPALWARTLQDLARVLRDSRLHFTAQPPPAPHRVSLGHWKRRCLEPDHTVRLPPPTRGARRVTAPRWSGAGRTPARALAGSPTRSHSFGRPRRRSKALGRSPRPGGALIPCAFLGVSPGGRAHGSAHRSG